jgi:hypothetical protein
MRARVLVMRTSSRSIGSGRRVVLTRSG